MPWPVAKPQEKQTSERVAVAFLREIFTRNRFGSFTWNPPSVGANTTVETTLTTTDAPQIEGLRVGMAVYVSPPSTLDAGLVVGGCYVATDNELTIRLGNLTAAPINAVSGTWAFDGRIV
mgnify:CR=1 FL=1